jgi:hypothetical protein
VAERIKFGPLRSACGRTLERHILLSPTSWGRYPLSRFDAVPGLVRSRQRFASLGHCWLTNRTNIPTAINRASRVPTTTDGARCRRSMAFDPFSAPLRCLTRREGCSSTDTRYSQIGLGLHGPQGFICDASSDQAEEDCAPDTSSSVPFEGRPRSAQDSNRSNHQQPEWKHPKARNRLQSQSRQQQPLPA